jgi:SEC-C motif
VVHLRPGRNDLCWCRSGKKYKHCHLDGEPESPVSEKALRSAVMKQFTHKTCMHPDAALGRCNRIVDAHTIQRARTLQQLCDDTNHVMTFSRSELDAKGLFQVQSRGWRQASTFTGFCGMHDSLTFVPIEDKPFEFSTQSAFLLSYRAMCHELYQKQSGARAVEAVTPLLEKGRQKETIKEIRRQNDLRLAGIKKAIENLQATKTVADQSLKSATYDDWNFVCVDFDGMLSIATTGASTPTVDLSGAPLQTLHDPQESLQHLYLSIVSRNDGASVVFGWRRDHDAPKRMVRSLLAVSDSLLATYITQYVFAHFENVCFAKSWWNSLDENTQLHVRRLALNVNPYYSLPTYVEQEITPWKLKKIHCSGEA